MNASLLRVLVLAAAAAPAFADAASNPYHVPNYTFPDRSAGFAFTTSGGRENPGVLVGFDPQPDPPATPTLLDLSNPTVPLFSQTGGDSFIVTVSLFPERASSLLPAVQAPGRDGTTNPSFCDGSVIPAGCDGSVFVLSLGFSGPGGVIDWVAFNPQPDPPGDFFSYQFSFGAPGGASFTLAITENEVPLTFSVAPEPATWALMGLGFAAIGAFATSLRARSGSG